MKKIIFEVFICFLIDDIEFINREGDSDDLLEKVVSSEDETYEFYKDWL